jgi:hypothetical protein
MHFDPYQSLRWHLNSFDCLALKHVLAGEAVPAVANERARVQELAFSEIREAIC